LFILFLLLQEGDGKKNFATLIFFSHNYSASLETHYVCVWVHIDRFNIAN